MACLLACAYSAASCCAASERGAPLVCVTRLQESHVLTESCGQSALNCSTETQQSYVVDVSAQLLAVAPLALTRLLLAANQMTVIQPLHSFAPYHLTPAACLPVKPYRC